VLHPSSTPNSSPHPFHNSASTFNLLYQLKAELKEKNEFSHESHRFASPLTDGKEAGERKSKSEGKSEIGGHLCT
jgi:hypothetical protein